MSYSFCYTSTFISHATHHIVVSSMILQSLLKTSFISTLLAKKHSRTDPSLVLTALHATCKVLQYSAMYSKLLFECDLNKCGWKIRELLLFDWVRFYLNFASPVVLYFMFKNRIDVMLKKKELFFVMNFIHWVPRKSLSKIHI